MFLRIYYKFIFIFIDRCIIASVFLFYNFFLLFKIALNIYTDILYFPYVYNSIGNVDNMQHQQPQMRV